ncbi:protein of unknown function [Nitrospira japonica]|uniref:Zona occludens toxin N-terminal domain-containing protein n=1 Tax=Nitrospira japonica TaxID=1325564 RepID=A0A1W1I8J5_9BACT|nr:zonular occludens toxin domain-containing protein [Nitrospira japonica]SLM49326.1 protein of unknown function [Nitrospira japonica]
MIELLEGVPGAGKSYHAVAEYLLPWVRKGRRIYVYVDGFYLDRLAKFEGRPLEELENQITVWSSGAEVLDQLTKVDPGSAVFIDECQTVFRAQQKLNGEILRWLETHRHYGIDVLLICQDYRQVTSGVTRVVEMTTKFRRLDRFGFKNRYQAFVRGNPEEIEVIRGFTGTYEPTVYAYYGSYATPTKEVRHVRSILRSPSIILGALGLCSALGWFVFGGGTFGKGTALPPPPVSASLAAVHVTSQLHEPSAPLPVVRPIRIQGGMSDPRHGRDEWLWITDDGRLLTLDEIAAESGGTVQAVTSRGVKVLKGSGVLWGGTASTPSVSAGSRPEPVLAPSRLPTRTDLLVAPTSARVGQSVGESPDLVTSDPTHEAMGQGTEGLP